MVARRCLWGKRNFRQRPILSDESKTAPTRIYGSSYGCSGAAAYASLLFNGIHCPIGLRHKAIFQTSKQAYVRRSILHKTMSRRLVNNMPICLKSVRTDEVGYCVRYNINSGYIFAMWYTEYTKLRCPAPVRTNRSTLRAKKIPDS